MALSDSQATSASGKGSVFLIAQWGARCPTHGYAFIASVWMIFLLLDWALLEVTDAVCANFFFLKDHAMLPRYIFALTAQIFPSIVLPHRQCLALSRHVG